MARSVRDAVVLLAAMAGQDPDDEATAERPTWSPAALIERVDADGLAGKRIGVLRSSAGFHSNVDELLEAALETMRDGGAEIVDDLQWQSPDGFSQQTYDVLLYEFKHGLNAYLAGLPDPELAAMTLADLIAFNRDHADEEMPWFGQEIFIKAEDKGPLSDAAYTEALASVRAATRADGIDALLAEHDLDALIAPTGAPAWSIDRVNGDHFLGGSSTLAAVAGYPNITVPMGQVHGLPVGLSVFGARYSEPVLIEIASGFEAAAGGFAPPAR
jgi:amidase